MPGPACDFLVIGGGVVGLSVARELKRRRPAASVVLLEKEDAPGLHASGRNSGVLHAGFYYTADSLKARFCRDGSRALASYCEARKLPLRRCGKLVIARDDEEDAVLDALLARGRANGVRVELVDAQSAREIEPRARVRRRALWSPDTAVTDPAAVVAALAADARAEGVDLRSSSPYLGRDGDAVLTASGRLSAGFVVNCAGLQADRVARDFGFSQRCAVLPFKGLYLYGDEPPGSFKAHVYPVPDIRNPFLGVHFTVTAAGGIKIGPTAIPALWREHYDGLSRFDLGELSEIAWLQARLFLGAGFDFRRLALEEIRKNFRSVMVRQAAALVDRLDPAAYTRWGKPGLRAQLVDLETKSLVMDFLIEGDARSRHVLNAVSPGFTCAIPFAAHICDGIVGDARWRAS